LLTSLQDEQIPKDWYSDHVHFPEGQLKLGVWGTEIPLSADADSPRKREKYVSAVHDQPGSMIDAVGITTLT
jgi:hypothetical protein